MRVWDPGPASTVKSCGVGNTHSAGGSLGATRETTRVSVSPEPLVRWLTRVRDLLYFLPSPWNGFAFSCTYLPGDPSLRSAVGDLCHSDSGETTYLVTKLASILGQGLTDPLGFLVTLEVRGFLWNAYVGPHGGSSFPGQVLTSH